MSPSASKKHQVILSLKVLQIQITFLKSFKHHQFYCGNPQLICTFFKELHIHCKKGLDLHKVFGKLFANYLLGLNLNKKKLSLTLLNLIYLFKFSLNKLFANTYQCIYTQIGYFNFSDTKMFSLHNVGLKYKFSLSREIYRKISWCTL